MIKKITGPINEAVITDDKFSFFMTNGEIKAMSRNEKYIKSMESCKPI
jgi:hypothetical protein